MKAQACRLGRWVAATVTGSARAATTGAACGWTATQTKVAAIAHSVPSWSGFVWQLRTPVLLAVGVGGTLAIGCYPAGPLVASAVGGLAGAKEALRARLRRAAREFGPTAGW